MKKKYFWPGIIIFSAMLAGIFSWVNFTNSLRSLILFVFMLVIPGLAITRLFHLNDVLAESVLAIAISLGIGTILGEFMVFSHLWSPKAGLDSMIVISLIGAFVQIIKSSDAIPEKGE